MLLRIMITNFEDIHTQYRAGLVDQSTLDGIVAGVKLTLAMPVMQAEWMGLRPAHAADIAALVDGLIEDLSPVAARRSGCGA